MLNPRYPAAVVAGNVETSQCITDALYGALGVMAASQGTMNNFTFGNDRHQYYETICGGSGAGPDFNGTDVVQTHMTNSRLTDPEVLEWRYPVLVEAFSIRHGERRPRASTRRRRRGAPHKIPRAHDRRDPVGPSRRRALRHGRRRAGRRGAQQRRARRWRDREPRRHRPDRDGARRRVRDRNARRRRLRLPTDSD